MAAYAKYTPAGIEARRDALAGGVPLDLATFKISATDIDLEGENTVDDLPNFWIEKPITSYRTIGTDRLEFRLYVPKEEAIQEGKSFALYLGNGTPLIVGTPPNTYNKNIGQEYLVQVEFVNNEAGEFSFVYIDSSDCIEIDNLTGFIEAINQGKNVRLKSGITLESTETLILQDGQIIDGNGATLLHTFNNNLFESIGSVVSETPLTTEINTHSYILEVDDASIFEVGETIRLVSSVDSLDTTAGSMRLGRHTASGMPSYFAEFLEIESIEGNTLKMASATIFKQYPLAKDPQTNGSGRTTSVVQKIDFRTNVLKNLNIDSRVYHDIIRFEYHSPKTKLKNVNFNKNKKYGGSLHIRHSFRTNIKDCNFKLDADTKMRYGNINQDAEEDFSSYNSVYMLSCQECVVDGGLFENGSQNVDVSYMSYSAINNTIKNTHVSNAKFNFHTSHWGTYGTKFLNNVGTAIRGISYRGRMNTIRGNEIVGTGVDISPYTGSTTSGAYSAGGWAIDSIVQSNRIEGFYRGVYLSDYSAGIVGLPYFRQNIIDNSISKCNTGVVLTRSPSGANYATANKSGIVVKGNVFKLIKTNTLLANTSYINGIIFAENTVLDTTLDYAVKFEDPNNISNLFYNNTFAEGQTKIVYMKGITNTALLGENTLVASGNKSYGNIVQGRANDNLQKSVFDGTQVSFLNFTPSVENVDYINFTDSSITTLNTNGATVMVCGNSTGDDIIFTDIIGHIGQKISLYGTETLWFDPSDTIITRSNQRVRVQVDALITFRKITSNRWIEE